MIRKKTRLIQRKWEGRGRRRARGRKCIKSGLNYTPLLYHLSLTLCRPHPPPPPPLTESFYINIMPMTVPLILFDNSFIGYLFHEHRPYLQRRKVTSTVLLLLFSPTSPPYIPLEAKLRIYQRKGLCCYF